MIKYRMRQVSKKQAKKNRILAEIKRLLPKRLNEINRKQHGV